MIRIGDVTADIALSEDHKYENDVTSHPAEKGSNFTDNVIQKPLAISLDCIISATPMGENLNAAFGPDIVTGCRLRLQAINDQREPITVVTSHGTFPHMLIESLTFSRTIKTGEALAFKIAVKDFRIVENERTVIRVALPRAQADVKRGAKSSKAPPDNTPAKAEDKRSKLRKVARYIGAAVSNEANPGGG